jgi:uncharacterized membrane protein YhaH (DUF805 family)
MAHAYAETEGKGSAMKLLLELFGNWSGTRLARRRFAILWLLLFVELFAGLALMALISLAWVKSFLNSSIPAITFMVTTILFFAGMLNITLKRGRDIGVPGFITAIVFFVALMMGGVPIFLNVLLAFVPAGALRLKAA